MSLSPIKETQGQMLYMFCIFVTAVLIPMKPLWSLISILWGFFGFYRYLYLSAAKNIKIPKILTLPSRILFDITQQQKTNINYTIQRLYQKDIIMMFLLTIAFIGWGIYCSLNPLQLSLFENFWNSKQEFLSQTQNMNNYAIVEKFSFLLTGILIFFIGMTYQPTVKFLWFIFIPQIVLITYIFIFLPFSSALLDANFTYLKGIGWGQFDAFQLLSNTPLNNGFFIRYIETGLIGALAHYLIFLPIAWTCLKQYHQPFTLLAFIILLAITALDVFWPFHPLILSIQVLFIACSAMILRRFNTDAEKP